LKKARLDTALFLDIGGVLITDGWDNHARKRAATNLKLEMILQQKIVWMH
jgi:hypothetical protein